jgi:hypothetical protein
MALKRLAWLFVELMQQFYTEDRTIYRQGYKEGEKEGEGGPTIDYQRVNTSKAGMMTLMRPNEPDPTDQRQVKEYQQEQKDYEKFKEFVSEFGELDPVHADFDIVIETNSTLPMDKQSLANLFLRLLQMKAIDPEAVLKQLKIPRYKEIIKRLQAQAQMQAQMKAGGNGQRPPRMPGPRTPAPQDLSDLVSVNARPEGV